MCCLLTAYSVGAGLVPYSVPTPAEFERMSHSQRQQARRNARKLLTALVSSDHIEAAAATVQQQQAIAVRRQRDREQAKRDNQRWAEQERARAKQYLQQLEGDP